MSWKCGININEVDVIPDAPVVADDILKSMDIENKGWKYDYVRGYTFFGSVAVADDVLKDGRLAIKFHKVGGHLDCSYCGLVSLEGCPESVGGNFDCRSNELTSLEGCPESVGGNFECGYNQLTSLKGGPETVGGDFDCEGNQLTSLEGCAQAVGGGFYCSDNLLTSLEGCPKTVGDFLCDGNKVEFTPDEVEAVCEVKNAIYC